LTITDRLGHFFFPPARPPSLPSFPFSLQWHGWLAKAGWLSSTATSTSRCCVSRPPLPTRLRRGLWQASRGVHLLSFRGASKFKGLFFEFGAGFLQFLTLAGGAVAFLADVVQQFIGTQIERIDLRARRFNDGLRKSQFCAMAKALDLPGRPMVNLKVGRSVLMSNSSEALTTPSVECAKVFNSGNASQRESSRLFQAGE
jgi:hypothetical protein